MLCRDRCGYCTFAKAPARLAAPYLTGEEVLTIARAGREAGCHEALFTLGERPELRYPVARDWLGAHGLRVDGGLSRGGVPPRRGGDGPPPPRQRRRIVRRRAGAAARGLGQPGDDARVTGRGAGGPPRRTRQGAGAPAGHPGGGGRARHPVHHRHPGRHRRRPARAAGGPARHRGVARPPRPRARGHRPELPPQAGDGDGAGRALPAGGPRLGRRGGPPRAAAGRSTSRRPRTSPTTWRPCSMPASTTGAACRPSPRTTSTPSGPGRHSTCCGTRPRRPATCWRPA